MVIHGGAFTVGDAMTFGDAQLGPFLVSSILFPSWKLSMTMNKTCLQISKNIIIVTVQYRLGYLGLWRTSTFRD